MLSTLVNLEKSSSMTQTMSNLYIDNDQNRFWYIIKDNDIKFTRPDGPCIELTDGSKFFINDFQPDDLYAELLGKPLQRNNTIIASIYLHVTFSAKLELQVLHNLQIPEKRSCLSSNSYEVLE